MSNENTSTCFLMIESMDFQQLTELETAVRIVMARLKRGLAKGAGYALAGSIPHRDPESLVGDIVDLEFDTPIGLLKVVDLEFDTPTVTLNGKKIGTFKDNRTIRDFELELIGRLHWAVTVGEAEWEVMHSMQKYCDSISAWMTSTVHDE